MAPDQDLRVEVSGLEPPTTGLPNVVLDHTDSVTGYLNLGELRIPTAGETFVAFDVLRVRRSGEMTGRIRAGACCSTSSSCTGSRWCAVPQLRGPVADVGACAEHDVEGIVAKRVDSPYRPGERSSDWLKLKNGRLARRPRLAAALALSNGDRRNVDQTDRPNSGPLRGSV
jgi:hypothetical protein